MSDPTGRSPKARTQSHATRTLPGVGGSESPRKTVGSRHKNMGAGKKKYGPGTGKNQGDGEGT